LQPLTTQEHVPSNTPCSDAASCFFWAFVAGTAAVGLTQSPELAFDVVSIKRNVSDDRSIDISSPGGSTFNMTNVALIGVVARAYGVKTVVNGPAWLTGEPGHPGLKPFTRDCDAIRAEQEAAMRSTSAEAAADRAGQQPRPPSPNSGPACGYTWSSAIYSGGIPLVQLAGMLDWVAGRVIVDRTGLPGRYEFTLRFASPTAPPSDAVGAPPVLFTALQEQLGLRLDAVRAPVDTLVIDHIERPNDN
jgi:hypothetical protein